MVKETPSKAWYFLPILLGLIGGVIAYFVIKDEDRKMANKMLIIGIVMTIVLSFVYFFLFAILFASFFGSVFSPLTGIQEPNVEPIREVLEQQKEEKQSIYIIEITASGGENSELMKFQGSIGAGTTQSSINGITPKSYEIEWEFPAVVAVIQKQEERGTLTITIKTKDGKVLEQQSTSATYGIVTVSA